MRSQVAQPAKLSYITCLAMRPVGVCFIEPYIFILHSNHKRCEGNCQDFWLKIKIYFAPEVVPQKERLAELMQTKVCNANERKIGCQSELERVKKKMGRKRNWRELMGEIVDR